MKPIAVVILNWNGAKLLTQYLPSVCQHTSSEIADVIVADNGSTDESLSILQNEFPAVRRIEFSRNYGFAAGYNEAIEQLSGYKYVVLLNSDVEVTPHWLEPMLAYAESHPQVAAMQPKIRAYRDKEYFEYAGAVGGFLDCNGYPYCRGRIFSTIEKDMGQYDDVCEIAWASGAALFVNTSLYRQAGGLDAAFFAHMEEIDLCWRIRLMGYRIVVVPQSVVYHYGGASLDNSNPHKLYLNYRNNLLMMYKNMPYAIRDRRIFIRQLYDGISVVKYIVSGQFKYVKAVWNAHRDYRIMKCRYDNKVTENRLNDLPQGRINIIWRYFICRQTKYSSLPKH